VIRVIFRKFFWFLANGCTVYAQILKNRKLEKIATVFCTDGTFAVNGQQDTFCRGYKLKLKFLVCIHF